MTQKTKQQDKPNKKRVWSHITAFFSRWSKKEYKWFGFILLSILALANILLMTLYMLDDEYNFPILQQAYISAVSPDQDVTSTMYTSIVKITPFDEQTVQVGDQVIVYGDFGLSEYWVETVTDVLPGTHQVELQYVDNITITTRYDSVVGVYQSDASWLGQIYYSASFTYGYVLWLIAHIIIVVGYYIALLSKRNQVVQ